MNKTIIHMATSSPIVSVLLISSIWKWRVIFKLIFESQDSSLLPSFARNVSFVTILWPAMADSICGKRFEEGGRLVFTLQQSSDLYNIIEANFKQNQQSPDWDEMIFCSRSNWLLSDKHQDRIVIIYINFIVSNPLNINDNANTIIPVRTYCCPAMQRQATKHKGISMKNSNGYIIIL